MKDLVGNRYGRLTVIEQNGRTKYKNVLWKCKCDCGNFTTVASNKLLQGKTKSCGCLASELKSKRATKHGLTKDGKKPRTFIIWNGMKARCLNENSINFHRYGGRGVKICDEWLVFENFHNWALSNGYSDDLTLDRINNDGNYEPENCRWIKWEKNLIMQSRYTILTVNGVTKSLSAFAKLIGKDRNYLRRYYNENGKEKTELLIKNQM